MKAGEARQLGSRIAARVDAGELQEAYDLLAPVLVRRTPFEKLGLIGEAVGAGEPVPVNAFLERVASEKTEGGWVVIGKALGQQLENDLAGAFERCRGYIIAADVWYGADILGERVPGPALTADFERALALLDPWRTDENVWVRRVVGVAIHFWAKRSRGEEHLAPQAAELVEFLEPLFEEWEMPAVKGIGWGLKTLGRHYPELVVEWLPRQLQRRHRAVMVRKAVTYLSEEQRTLVRGRA